MKVEIMQYLGTIVFHNLSFLQFTVRVSKKMIENILHFKKSSKMYVRSLLWFTHRVYGEHNRVRNI